MIAGEVALLAVMRPWERRMTRVALQRWLIRGALGSLVLASSVLLVGWIVPQPESELRPWALQLMVVPLLTAAGIAVWPRRHALRAAELDTRLHFGDRLATAWVFHASDGKMVDLQRLDAIDRLRQRVPRTDLAWRPARRELIALGVAALVTLVFFVIPSPQQAVLDKQAADDLAVQQASEQIDALRQEAGDMASLTPDQARQLNELLQQTQAELSRTHTQADATSVLARAESQLAQQLVDPNADLRDEALAAMSETLAAEPQTHALADALQREDAQAVSDALNALAAQADQESDVERQALSRALQRASNVGRAESRSAAALHDAAQAVSAGKSAGNALSNADSALQEAMRASQQQASVNTTLDRLRQLQADLASGNPLRRDTSGEAGSPGRSTANPLASGLGTPVALDSGGSLPVRDPSQIQGGMSAGLGPADGSGQAADGAGPAAENVFVPGREGNGPAQQDLVDQPFTVRGAPRPYRDVLTQYAQSSRDYVDRPDISPAVRDLVKQYFQALEDGQ
jgi:hypothetical protein